MVAVSKYKHKGEGAVNGISICSSCYIGPLLKENPKLSVIGPSKPMLDSGPSYGFRSPGSATRYMPEHLRATDFSFTPNLYPDGTVEARTTGNHWKWHISEMIDDRGNLVYIDHPKNLNSKFNRWKDGSVQRPNTYHRPSREGLMAEFPERTAFIHPEDAKTTKFLSDYVYQGPMNAIGKYFSFSENFRQDLRGLLFDSTQRQRFDPDMENFVDHLAKKYGAPETTIIGIGSERMPQALANIRPYPEGSVICGATDFSRQVDTYISRYGLSGIKARQLKKMAIVYHELTHHFQGLHKNDMSVPKAEMNVAETLIKYFSGKAKENSGTDLGWIYKTLTEIEQDYRSHYESKEKSFFSKSRLENIITEAAKLGLSGEKARSYVARRIGEESTKEKIESGLEARVKESKNSEGNSKAKGRESKHYDQKDSRDSRYENSDDKAYESKGSEVDSDSSEEGAAADGSSSPEGE